MTGEQKPGGLGETFLKGGAGDGFRPLYAHPPAQASESGGGNWRPITTAPANETILLWVGGPHRRVAFGRLIEYHDGERSVQIDGWQGDYDKIALHWMPLPTEPGFALSAALSAPQAAPACFAENANQAVDPRVTEWGYSSTDEALTHLGKLLEDQAAFDGLAQPNHELFAENAKKSSGEGEGES